MNIGVVGLGLIGGSVAKAAKANTRHAVFGFDGSETVMKRALESGVIDGILDEDAIGRCEIIVIALYPGDAIEYVRQNAPYIPPNAVVVDCCGVKRLVCDSLRRIAEQNGFVFVGGHPMAGTERWGFEASQQNLFRGATMLITPDVSTPDWALERIERCFLDIGFGYIQRTTSEEHDHMIAFTSQLAHVLSCAYVTAESAPKVHGFSAGSFRDMTRVAHLNEAMWSELFLENSDLLADEIDGMIERLFHYSRALHERDRETLFNLLKSSRETKEQIDAAMEKGAVQ